LTDFGLSTGFHKEHDAGYYKKLLAGGAHKSNRDNRQSMNLDQIQLTVSNRTQINTWRKSRRQLAYSTVGTPDYIAPEIFSGQGYDYSCDWWSVGTIMFECLIGWPPFCAEEPHDTYRKIVDWPRNLHFPPDQQLGAEAEDFVRRLVPICHDMKPHHKTNSRLDSFATQNTASVVSAAPAKSSNIPSSVGCRGMVCAVFELPLNPNCSPTLTRSTSPLMKLTRMIPLLLTGRRQLKPTKTSTQPACRLSDIRTSASMLSEAHRSVWWMWRDWSVMFFTGAAHQKDEISLLSQQKVLAGLAGIGVGRFFVWWRKCVQHSLSKRSSPTRAGSGGPVFFRALAGLARGQKFQLLEYWNGERKFMSTSSPICLSVCLLLLFLWDLLCISAEMGGKFTWNRCVYI